MTMYRIRIATAVSAVAASHPYHGIVNRPGEMDAELMIAVCQRQVV